LDYQHNSFEMAHSISFQKFKRILHQAHCKNLSQNLSQNPNTTKASRTQYKRRKFLKMSALAGSAAIATTAIPLIKAAESRATPPKIAIVGGGIAGLNAAYQLNKVGLKATVYEAKSRVGGRIHSVTGVAGAELVTDLGGSFINSNHADMLALAKEFNLTLFHRAEATEKSPFPAEGYFFDGKLYPEAEVAEKLRPLARQIVNDAGLLEQDYEKYAPIFDRLSVAQYLTQHADKITAPFVRVLLESAVRAEYGVEPESSSTLQLLFILTTVEKNEVTVVGGSDEAYVVQSGSGKIIESLAAVFPERIKTNKRLQKIMPDGDSYRLLFSDRSIVDADYVIIAIPVSVLRHLDFQVELEPKFKRFMQEVNLGKNDKVIAGFDNRVWLQKEGFTETVWSDLGFCQAWDDTQRQPEQQNSALTFFLGGNEVSTNQAKSPATLKQDFIGQFEQIIPQAKSSATGKLVRTSWSQDPLIKGGYTNFEPGQYTEFSEFRYIESKTPQERQQVAFGNLIFAGEHFSDEFYGYMNGGAQTGRLAATVITSKIAVVK
jgi:monoamine oxidase